MGSRQSFTQWTGKRTATSVRMTSSPGFALPPRSASPCTGKSSSSQVSWWLASFSTRWQSSTDLCRLSACTTDPSGHEPSFKSPRVAHFCFQIFYAGISDSLGVPRQPTENVWKETKEKYIFDREKK